VEITFTVLECLSGESFILNLYLKNIFTLKYFLLTLKPKGIILGVKTFLVIVIQNSLARYLALSLSLSLHFEERNESDFHSIDFYNSV